MKPSILLTLLLAAAVGLPPAKADVLGRGFTGHEHLPWFGLINMNARLYDPQVGQFLSPDPVIQMPDNSQNLNRYSYCLNNPLTAVDENGQFIIPLINALFESIVNLCSHGFNVSQYNWHKTRNSWNIDMSMFKGSFWQVVGKWTWGLHNSLVGYHTAQAINSFNFTNSVQISEMEGMLAISNVTGGNKAFTIGHFSFGPEGYRADWRDHLFVHEYGHFIQSLRLGPAYFSAVAIPSVMSAAFTSRLSGMDHNERWFETWASKLGGKYFDKKYGKDAKGYVKGMPYFEYDAFRNNKKPTTYENPRNPYYNYGKFPTSKKKLTIWDFIL